MTCSESVDVLACLQPLWCVTVPAHSKLSRTGSCCTGCGCLGARTLPEHANRRSQRISQVYSAQSMAVCCPHLVLSQAHGGLPPHGWQLDPR